MCRRSRCSKRSAATFTNVEHLTNGATFMVGSHSVSATVRGTLFEILVRPNNTNRIWVFVGSVRASGKTSITLTAGQEIDADANGTLSNQRSSQFDPMDPFPMTVQCAGAASNGNDLGTEQTSMSDSLSIGQTTENDYNSAGGNLTIGVLLSRQLDEA